MLLDYKLDRNMYWDEIALAVYNDYKVAPLFENNPSLINNIILPVGTIVKVLVEDEDTVDVEETWR